MNLAGIKEDDEGMFVHDVNVSVLNIYPYELQTDQAMNTALSSFKGLDKFRSFRAVISRSKNSLSLYLNLFWLYFTVKFQPAVYPDVCVNLPQFTPIGTL